MEVVMNKRLLVPARVRRVPRQFSWVDQRLVRDGHLGHCDADALALYLFVVTVADAQGLSFYGDEAIARLLQFSPQRLEAARAGLVRAGLLAYEAPLYQVLALAPEPAAAAPPPPPTRAASAPGELRAMREILRRAGVAS
jgi:hypothetical protein